MCRWRGSEDDRLGKGHGIDNGPVTRGDRRLSEQPSELAAELGGALVADAVRRNADLEPLEGDQTARCMQPQALQILNGRLSGPDTEGAMEGRDAHRAGLGEILDGVAGGEVPPHQVDCPIDPAVLRGAAEEPGESATHRPPDGGENDLPPQCSAEDAQGDRVRKGGEETP